MIRVSIEATDGAHLRHLLVGMLAGSNASVAQAQPVAGPSDPPSADSSSTAPSGDASANQASSSEEPPTPSEQRKRGRPPKAKAEPPAPTGDAPAPADQPNPTSPGGETPANPEATTPPATLELSDVRAALLAYSATHGVPGAGKLLEKYGAARVSDLKPEQYAAFYSECKA